MFLENESHLKEIILVIVVSGKWIILKTIILIFFVFDEWYLKNNTNIFCLWQMRVTQKK